MKFSKAIQIKNLVNRLNKDRREFNCGTILFQCTMFSIGDWGVTLKSMGSPLFYSCEIEQIFTLYAGGGFMMNMAARSNNPCINML